MSRFIFNYVEAHLVERPVHKSEEHELENMDKALDLADEINRVNGNDYVLSICSESGEKTDVRHLHYFHWRLRMGSHANGNESYVRKWYWAKDLYVAAEFAIALNQFLTERNPQGGRPWIDYVECQSNGTTVYI